MTDIIFWETLSGIAFFAAIVIALGFGIRTISKFLKQHFKEDRRHKSIMGTVEFANGEFSTLRGELIHRFVEAHESSNYVIRNGYKAVIVDYLTERLAYLFKIEKDTQVCGLNSNYCNTIYRLTDKEGNIFLLGLSWADKQLLDNKDRLNYTTKAGLNISDYTFRDDEDRERIVLTDMVEFGWPSTLPEQHVSVDAVLQAISGASVEAVQYEMEKMPHGVSIKKLAYYHGLGYSLVNTMQKIRILPNKVLDLSYADVSYEFAGKKHAIPVSKAMPVLIESLKLGENAILFGKPGVGKTRLLEQIQAKVGLDENVQVIIMQAAQVQELHKSEAMTAFQHALSNTKMKNIIFIDEGEMLLEKSASGMHTMDNSLVLQMMSGELQRTLNCQLVLAFNAKPEDLNMALFRKGRTGMYFNLGVLPKAKSDLLIEEIKRMYPERIFDKKQYESVITSANKTIDGETYAGANEITLADLYDCFPHKSKYSAIARALSLATGIKIEEPIATKAKVTKALPPKRAVSLAPESKPKPQATVASAVSLRTIPSKAPNKNPYFNKTAKRK